MLCAGGLWALARAAAEALRDLGGLEVREHLGKVRGTTHLRGHLEEIKVQEHLNKFWGWWGDEARGARTPGKVDSTGGKEGVIGVISGS